MIAGRSMCWIVSGRINSVRFVSSINLRKEMSGPTGQVRTIFRGLKASKATYWLDDKEISFVAQPWLWRFQDDGGHKKSEGVNSRNDLSSK